MPNQIDESTFFVTQHYLDFLNRDPDQSGLNFWVSQITSCNGDPRCIDTKRQNVSAAYFLSREFQETGFYVIKLQRAAFGKISSDATKRLSYTQFLTDVQAVGTRFIDGQPGADAVLNQNQAAYAENVVRSAAFIARYPATHSASDYVDALFATAGVTPTSAERQSAITLFGGGDTTGRAAVLRKVAETDTLKNDEFNGAFVLLAYFGYLRHNPNDPPDNNDSGYQFWLNKLNQFNGDYLRAEFVRSFILSAEYRGRFCTTLNAIRFLSIAKLANGHLLLRGVGIASQVHTVMATDDISQPFVVIGSIITDENGRFQYEETNPNVRRFYSASYP